MKKVVITDTHFGVKQNSINWFNAQKDFIYNELIPFLDSLDELVYLYHCGDVFDSRSSINPMIAKEVRKIFKDLTDHVQHIYILAGNHDFYSPVEDDVTSIEMVLSNIPGLTLVTNSIFINKEDLLVPWYEFDKYDNLKECIEKYQTKAVFCHTDLTMLSPEYKELLKNVKVFSGHIHTPLYNKNLITLGSTYALTFADHNAERGFYLINDDYSCVFHPAKNIIKFYRFTNEEIFSINIKEYKSHYVELYINKINLLNERYIERIKECTKQISNITVIPISDNKTIEESVEFANYNIEEICKKNIPKNLLDKFEQIIKQNPSEEL